MERNIKRIQCNLSFTNSFPLSSLLNVSRWEIDEYFARVPQGKPEFRCQGIVDVLWISVMLQTECSADVGDIEGLLMCAPPCVAAIVTKSERLNMQRNAVAKCHYTGFCWVGFYPRTLAISSANLANLAPDINSPLNHWELMTLCPYFSLLSFELTIYYYDTFLFFTYPLMFWHLPSLKSDV